MAIEGAIHHVGPFDDNSVGPQGVVSYVGPSQVNAILTESGSFILTESGQPILQG